MFEASNRILTTRMIPIIGVLSGGTKMNLRRLALRTICARELRSDLVYGVN